MQDASDAAQGARQHIVPVICVHRWTVPIGLCQCLYAVIPIGPAQASCIRNAQQCNIQRK